MKKWVTHLEAIDAKTGEMKLWAGEHVEAPTFEMAQEWCYQNKGYLKVVGELIAETDDKITVDYQNIQNN